MPDDGNSQKYDFDMYTTGKENCEVEVVFVRKKKDHGKYCIMVV